MKILKAGTKVIITMGKIEAMVIGVVITINEVEYKLRYFSGGEEKIVWLFRFEIEIAPLKQDAGFIKKPISDYSNEINLQIT